MLRAFLHWCRTKTEELSYVLDVTYLVYQTVARLNNNEHDTFLKATIAKMQKQQWHCTKVTVISIIPHHNSTASIHNSRVFNRNPDNRTYLSQLLNTLLVFDHKSVNFRPLINARHMKLVLNLWRNYFKYGLFEFLELTKKHQNPKSP